MYVDLNKANGGKSRNPPPPDPVSVRVRIYNFLSLLAGVEWCYRSRHHGPHLLALRDIRPIVPVKFRSLRLV